MVIGLGLAPTAAKLSGLTADIPETPIIAIALFTLLITILSMTLFQGFLRIIPIIIGILGGSAMAFVLGQCSLEKIYQAPWIAIPPLYTPEWSLPAIIILIPAFFVTLIEVIGHLQVTQTIVATDMFRDPGLFRVLVSKGISSTISGFFGS